jgi:PRTRC genetic system protein E
MFKELHAMAKDAMLLITATAEGDQLRVSVTPTYPDGKVPAGAAPLRPLSVIASPEELDADFAAVLAFWKTPTPKQTLLEQAQAAAGDGDDGAGSKPADVQPKVRIAAKPVDVQPKAKTSRKSKADDAAGAAAPGPAATGAGKGEGSAESFALTGTESNTDAAPTVEPVAEPAPDAVPVDTFTIDLF